jgi:excisionase family DNA binding protein
VRKNREHAVPPALFSIPEAADYLRISRATFYRMLKADALPRVKLGGRTLIRIIDLDALLERSIERKNVSLFNGD